MMDLEHITQQQSRIVFRRVPSKEVLDEVHAGRKFIVVESDFDEIYTPTGYMLIDMRYKGDSFKTLVPQNLLFYLANPGEGDVDSALDEISDFYGNVKDFEDDLLEENGDSVQGTNWAVTARESYQTYLINKLTRAGANPDVPEWDPEALKSLGLDDKYVLQRVRAIAAVALQKSPESLKQYGIGDVLKHVTIRERKVEALTREEFDTITLDCWAGSHYEIRDEYRNLPDVRYDIERMHDKNHKAGVKITESQSIPVLDKRVDDLEQEIELHRKEKGMAIGRHDRQLIRTYANAVYIAKEDASKQLAVMPDSINALVELDDNASS